MIQKFIHKILIRHHFWRHADFDELSEVYVAMMLRSLALGIIGVFIPIYLITLGYGFAGVAQFFCFLFLSRVFMDIGAGYIVARFGPKHGMLVSYILEIVAAGMLLTLESASWPLFVPAVIWGASNSVFFVAFHVDFSKIKHSDHGGKELGMVNIAEKIGHTIGPAIGGLAATLFGPQYLFLFAVILLLFGLVPLFRTAEPVKTRQHLDYKSFDVTPVIRDYFSYTFLALEHNIALVLWPTFLALFVFDENIYATIGGLTSIGVLVAIASAYVVGKLVDAKRGKQLLQVSTVTNAVIHLFRPFTGSLPLALGINMSSEALAVGSRISYTKGWYDAADSQSGHRIVYLSSIESAGSALKFLFWGMVLVWIGAVPVETIMFAGFVVAAVCSLLVNVQGFKALQ